MWRSKCVYVFLIEAPIIGLAHSRISRGGNTYNAIQRKETADERGKIKALTALISAKAL